MIGDGGEGKAVTRGCASGSAGAEREPDAGAKLGDPGSILFAGRGRRTRGNFPSASIRAGRTGTSAASSAHRRQGGARQEQERERKREPVGEKWIREQAGDVGALLSVQVHGGMATGSGVGGMGAAATLARSLQGERDDASFALSPLPHLSLITKRSRSRICIFKRGL